MEPWTYRGHHCFTCLALVLHSQSPCQMGIATGESTSWGVVSNVYLSVPYMVVQCLVEMENCKDALCPV